MRKVRKMKRNVSFISLLISINQALQSLVKIPESDPALNTLEQVYTITKNEVASVIKVIQKYSAL